jgi:hypothetical protein
VCQATATTGSAVDLITTTQSDDLNKTTCGVGECDAKGPSATASTDLQSRGVVCAMDLITTVMVPSTGLR